MFYANKQLKLNLNLDFFIPSDSDVKLLHSIFQNIHIIFPESTMGRRRCVPPEIMLEIIIYGYMNKKFSSRAICDACSRDVNFMWLLQGYKAPSHNSISRFREKFTNIDDVLSAVVSLLHSAGEVTFDEVFIDGTKLEANANKYTFVWKKSVSKNEANLQTKIAKLLDDVFNEFFISASSLQELITKLKEREITFVYGKGKRKSKEQRFYEIAVEYADRLAVYTGYNALFDGRNSFSKTDSDATFMRMKEDHMLNGQLKPGYNLQIAVNSEYITSCYCSSDRDDVNTLIPFLQKMEAEHGEKYTDIVADSGYESEENYLFLENNEQNSYIKPSNYERSKTRKYKNNKYMRENMPYDEAGDFFVCPNGKKLEFAYTTTKKSKNGYASEVSVYECESCESCPHKKQCTKAKGNRKIVFSKNFNAKRAKSLENITTDKGSNLRMNRSIQVEGAFGVMKQDYGFRRFLMRGMKNVKIEFTLLCIAYDIKKLHNKFKNSRTQTHLFVSKE